MSLIYHHQVDDYYYLVEEYYEMVARSSVRLF
jgi:hypothetical protein